MTASPGWQPSIGALLRPGGVFFRVWAPDRRKVEVVLYEHSRPTAVHPLGREADGYWSGIVPNLGPGAAYMYRLDGALDRPDPASRCQPAGVHGPSQVVDESFPWTDAQWRGISREALVIYEMHTGTATQTGVFEALIERLPCLRELGISAIELMPVADFPGGRSWGYDGVCLYAPAQAYGGGRGLKRLVDAAHALGLAVLLDVVYNHLGPSGNYLRDFARGYFTSSRRTPWGEALNYDGPGSPAVRSFFIENALYWVHEYHLDGLRLDATQEIIDSSPEHLLAELSRRVHASLPAGRQFLLIAEDPRNEASLLRPHAEGGCGLDGIWADNFSHSTRVTLTGEREGYLSAYSGGAEELVTELRDGWWFQGQVDPRTGLPHGTPTNGLPPAAFVFSIQTHDHVGNRAFGERLNHQVAPQAYRAVSALLLLAPGTPLLFMGQDWAASTPFLYFTDHEPWLGARVTAGRRKDFADFSAFHGADVPDPQALDTFNRSKLRWEELSAPPHAPIRRLYQDLIALRQRAAVYRGLQREHLRVAAAGEKAVSLLFAPPGARALLLVANLGGQAELDLAALAPRSGAWQLLLDSEDVKYGGCAPPLPSDGLIHLDSPRALVFIL